MRRALGFLAGALAALVICHPASAGIHGRGTTGGTPPVVPDLIVTMFQTQTKAVDLTSVTTHCTNTEFVNLTPVGTNATFTVDRGQQLIPSTTETWYKGELVTGLGDSDLLSANPLITTRAADNQAFNIVQTTGAPVGTGAATLNINCASSGLTKVVRVDVVAGPSFDWNYGVLTRLRFGGLDMNTFGTPSRFSVDTGANSCGTGVACSSIWEIWENHLMIKCVPNTGTCPASGANTGTYSSGNASNAITPTAGTSQDVLIDDSSGSPFSIHMHWTAHQWDVAITPTGSNWPITDGQDTSQWCLTQGQTGFTLHYGDTILAEGTRALRSTYGPYVGTSSVNRCNIVYTTRAQYSGGPLPELTIGGQLYTIPYSPAQIKVTCREPFECDVGAIMRINATNHVLNYRYTGFNTRGVSSGPLGQTGIEVTDSTNSSVLDYQVDHLRSDTIATNLMAGNGSYVYIMDNDMEGASGGVQIATCNSVVLGNRDLQPSNQDAFHLGMQACGDTVGDDLSTFSWQWLNGIYTVIANHLDNAQGDWSTIPLKNPLGNNAVYTVKGNLIFGAPFHIYDCGDVYTTGVHGTFSPASCSGNTGFSNSLFTAANCPNGVCASGGTGGTRSEDAQLFLMADGALPGATIKYLVYGNGGSSVFGNGIFTQEPGVGSVISYNAMFASQAMGPSPALALIGSGFSAPRIINSAAGAIITMDGNVILDAVNSLSVASRDGIANPGIDTPVLANLDSTNGATAASGCMPNVGQTYYGVTNFATRMQPNIDAMVLGAACVGHGPLQVVNYRRRLTTNPSAVLPHAGIPTNLAFCTAQPPLSHTNTGKAAGDVWSITTPVVWTGATNSPNSQWVIQYITGGQFAFAIRNVSGSTNTTYTLTSGDLTLGTSEVIYYLENSGIAAPGNNICQSPFGAIQ